MNEALFSDQKGLLSKMCNHADRMDEFAKGHCRPVNIKLTVNNKCNRRCKFCYVKGREGFDQNIDDIMHLVSILNPKSVDITGGEPTLYPHLDELLQYLVIEKGIEVGMVTNGYKLNKYHLKYLKWARISINPYVDEDQDDTNLLELEKHIPKDMKYGFSYIYNTYAPADWSTRLARFMEKHTNAEYVRINTDVELPEDVAKNVHKHLLTLDIPRKIVKLPLEMGKRPELCYNGAFSPFLENDGNIYRCAGECAEWFPRNPICNIKHPEDFFKYDGKGHKCEQCHNAFFNDFVQAYFDSKPHCNFV